MKKGIKHSFCVQLRSGKNAINKIMWSQGRFIISKKFITRFTLQEKENTHCDTQTLFLSQCFIIEFMLQEHKQSILA